MRRFLVISTLCLGLAGCDFFTAIPALPPLPEGSETVTGDGSWEVPYDTATIDWHRQFEAERPFLTSRDYWLRQPTTPGDVFRPYDQLFSGWNSRDDVDSRKRWTGRVYRNGGRVVAVAVFPSSKHGGAFDILRVMTGPKRWYDPEPAAE